MPFTRGWKTIRCNRKPTAQALVSGLIARTSTTSLVCCMYSLSDVRFFLPQFDNLYRLLDLLSERDPAVMVTVRKYAAASLLEVFKDLLPGYRLQEHDLTQKLKKETIGTYKYENALINSYKKYLIKLEEYTKALSSDQTPLKVRFSEISA